MNRSNTKRHSWQCEVKVSQLDQSRLTHAMRQELSLYNAINDALRMRLTSQPKILAEMTPRHRQAFAHAVGTRHDVRSREPLAEALRPFADLFTNADEGLLTMFEVARFASGISAPMRQAMAKQMIDFYAEQALLAVQAVPSAVRHEQAYKQPVAFLENYDIARKRHIQLHRALVTLKYDRTANRSGLFTPYTAKPLIIEGSVDDKVQFNHVIVHQKPGRPPTALTPWMVNFRQTDEDYLLDYVEMASPYGGSSFDYVSRTQRNAII